MTRAAWLPPDVPPRLNTEPEELVAEQFAPIVIGGVDLRRRVSAGPSEARRAELFAERDQLQRIAGNHSYSLGQQSLARGRIRKINAELAGNANQRAVVAWLKARSKHGKGGLDIETTEAALRLLPGWSMAERVALIAPSDIGLRNALHLSWRTATVNQSYRNKRWFEVRWPAQDPPLQIEAAPGPHGPELGQVYAASTQPREGDTISPDGPRGPQLHRLALSIFDPQVGVRIFTFRAPDGSTREVIEHPQGTHTDPLAVSPAFWRWAYEQGMAEAAADALPGAEAAVPKAASTVKVGKGQGTCPVCFEVHAVTNSFALMDHGYRRPGWGYNVEPCDGVKWPRYETSPRGSLAHQEHLQARLEAALIRQHALIQRQHADGKPVVLHRTVYVRDAQGRKIIDDSPEARELARALRRHNIEPEIRYVTRTDELLPGMEHYEEVRGRYLEQVGLLIKGLRGAIPFYKAAVKIWRKGGVPLPEIMEAAQHETA